MKKKGKAFFLKEDKHIFFLLKQKGKKKHFFRHETLFFQELFFERQKQKKTASTTTSSPASSIRNHCQRTRAGCRLASGTWPRRDQRPPPAGRLRRPIRRLLAPCPPPVTDLGGL